MSKSAEKQRRWRERRQAEGLLTVTVLVPESTKERLRGYAALLRNGTAPAGESETVAQLRVELATLARSRDWWRRKVRDVALRAGLEKEEAEVLHFEEQLKAESPDRYQRYVKEQAARTEGFSVLFGVGVQEPIGIDAWRWLMQQAHPDRNPGNPKAAEATAWLAKAKPAG